MNFSADVINQLGLNFSGFNFTIPSELLSANAFKITAPFTFTGMFPEIYLDEAIYQFGPTVGGVTVKAVPEAAAMVLC